MPCKRPKNYVRNTIPDRYEFNAEPPTLLIKSTVGSMSSASERYYKRQSRSVVITLELIHSLTEQMSNIYNELTYMDCVYYDLGAHEHNIYQ